MVEYDLEAQQKFLFRSLSGMYRVNVGDVVVATVQVSWGKLIYVALDKPSIINA